MPKVSTQPKENKPPGKKLKITISPWAKYFLVLLALIMLLIGAGSFWAYKTYVLDEETRRLNELSETYAQKNVDAISEQLKNIDKNLTRFLNRELLLKAIDQQDTATIDRFLGNLRSESSQFTAIQLIAHGKATLNPDSEPPIRFAEIDMINRAEKREQVFPEAVKIAQNWTINLVKSIPAVENTKTVNEENPTPVTATLFLNLPASQLFAAVNTSDLTRGRIKLLQQFSQGDALAVVDIGQGNAGAAQAVAVPNSYWTVEFTPSALLKSQVSVNPAGLFSSMILIALAGLLLSYLAANVLSRKAVAKAEQLHAAIEANKEALSDKSIIDPLHRSKKLAAVEVTQEDSNLLGAGESNEDPLDIRQITTETIHEENDIISAEIFRAYDIRGIVKTQIKPEHVVLIGKAIGSAALAAGEKAIIVGRDGRTHSPDISEQLIEGILSTGCNVINIGMVPTPLVYFAICELETSNSGVVVTASHNPAEYNGFKIVINNETYAGEKIQQLYSRIMQQQFNSGNGKEDFSDLSFQYVDRIFSDVALAGDISVVIDAGNGVAGDIAPRLFTEIGCNVTPLYCKVDGNFPNHEADPSVYENLQDLIAKVKEVGADLGVALDGDGDRVGIVTASGQIIAADRLLMLLTKDIVSRNPGADVIYDVKCSRELNSVITSYGGRPIMWKTGHSHMKAKMRETNALLGGELSGHIFIKERWYGFDDGMYAAARIIEIMSMRDQSLDEIFEAFPSLPATPELKIAIAENKKFKLVQKLVAESDFAGGKMTTIDGLRVDYPEGWGLVRASNTSPAITLRFEAESDEALAKIQQQFKNALLALEPDLTINF